MTATERQRRWREGKRLAQAAEPKPEPTPKLHPVVPVVIRPAPAGDHGQYAPDANERYATDYPAAIGNPYDQAPAGTRTTIRPPTATRRIPTRTSGSGSTPRRRKKPIARATGLIPHPQPSLNARHVPDTG